MKKADLFYANLEGPTAAGHGPAGRQVQDPGPVFDNYVYSGYPEFNYHPSLISDLKDSGVDLLSTANNHSLDRRSSGVVSTLDACDENGMPCFGTRRENSEAFYTITTKKNWKIAWVACTFSTNGIEDKNDLVLDCFSTNRVSELIVSLKNQVDAVIVTPHWGDEYQLSPNRQQQSFARKWLEEGASAVIGTHPHVPQTWEKYTTQDGQEKFILYSSGNFVSGQGSVPKRTALMLFLGLSKRGGKTWVNGVRYLPLFMSRNPLTVVASNWQDDISGPLKESLNLAVKTYGAERIVEPGEAVITNAECK
jgi:poly-gamma-glutamate synthesis protein (capsule biosynthesis protein)